MYCIEFEVVYCIVFAVYAHSVANEIQSGKTIINAAWFLSFTTKCAVLCLLHTKLKTTIETYKFQWVVRQNADGWHIVECNK